MVAGTGFEPVLLPLVAKMSLALIFPQNVVFYFELFNGKGSVLDRLTNPSYGDTSGIRTRRMQE